MASRLRLLDIFEGKQHQKTILMISVGMFLVLELLIYLGAASQAGQKSRIIITDPKTEKVIFEASGTVLTSYEKAVFEDNHGPLANYSTQIESRDFPFPFRAWVAAAVGIPVGLILLVSFLVKVFLLLLYGDEKQQDEDEPESLTGPSKRFAGVFRSFRHISVFHIGFVVLLCVFLLWMIPNLIEDFAKLSMNAVREYGWFFLGAAVFAAGLIVWVIYLRYRLSKQMLDNQLDLEKFRVEKQLLLQQPESPPLLPRAVNNGHDE